MNLTRLLLLSVLSIALLTSCARVVVFGHVVREGEAPDASPPANGATPAPAATGTPVAAAESAVPASRPAAAAIPTLKSATLKSATLKSVTLKMAPVATLNVASDTPFVPELLLDAIRAELSSRKLLDETNPQLTAGAEVEISQATVRPSTNAIVFGYKMMAGTLIGDIHFGGAAPDLHVLAETKLTLAVNGEKKDPLGPLYRRFAELTADRIQGVESKPDPNAGGGQPRY